MLALTFPNEDWHLTIVQGSECLKLACEMWLGPAPGQMICMLRQGLPGALEHPHPLILQTSVKNIRWKIVIESGTSHMLSLRSPIILFPLDSECRSKSILRPFLRSCHISDDYYCPSIMAHHFLLQQSLAGAWTVLKTGLAPCPSAQWFVSLGFYLVNQVNHVLKHLRCFSFCNIFLLFCQLSDCVFSSLTEEYLE